MTVADRLRPLVRELLGPDLPIRIGCWDGSSFGPEEAPAQLTFTSRRALRWLLWAPNELGMARAYVSGDVDVEGDMMAGLAALELISDPDYGPSVHIDGATRRHVAAAAFALGIVGGPPKVPAEEISLPGRLHTRSRDSAAISAHYDVGNDFYRLVLGESMTYSCAYFEQEPSQEFTLTDAQYAKCDLVARKLALAPGMRVLDVGCGWGTFAMHAAAQYGVSVVGVTVSRAQATLARKRVGEAGLSDLVEIRAQDYRDVADGPYDAVASIGMAEHVGADQLAGYAAHLYSLLRPHGRLLNHAIARRPGPRPEPSPTSFIDRYVFPDGELESLGTMVEELESAHFEVRDVESLRENYGLTLRAWVANLEQNWDAAVAASSPGRARIWRLYMAGSALAFEAGRLGVNQVLAVRPGRHGSSGVARTRPVVAAAWRRGEPDPPAGT
jgi:cyclopropane-fatty-acyl-phospholipid synthase